MAEYDETKYGTAIEIIVCVPKAEGVSLFGPPHSPLPAFRLGEAP